MDFLLFGYTPQIQSPIGLHTNSPLEKRYFLSLKSCSCSEIIDFPLQNGTFYQIRSSTGIAKRLKFLLRTMCMLGASPDLFQRGNCAFQD